MTTNAPNLSLAEYEKLQPIAVMEYAGKKVKYSTPTQHTLWRCQSLFTKEPDTIAWIATFNKNDILVDIGANVGMYSIWAAATRQCRVFAFEPEAHNFALLNHNIALNQLGNSVIAYSVALSDTTRFDKLHMSYVAPGGSGHTFGEKVNFKLQSFEPAFSQGSFSIPLDDLVRTGVIPVPTRIKIDVDGLEHKIIAGAHETLQNPILHSVLIETNQALPEHQAIAARMHEYGFVTDPAQIEQAQRKEGTFAGVGNIIYYRTL